jgi:hypothetical protein
MHFGFLTGTIAFYFEQADVFPGDKWYSKDVLKIGVQSNQIDLMADLNREFPTLEFDMIELTKRCAFTHAEIVHHFH